LIESDNSLSRLKQRYLDSVLIGEATSAGLVVEEGLKQGFGMFDIYLSILVPTQIDLGQAWHDGKVNVAQEHLATQITLDQMDRLRSQIFPRSKLGFRVAVTTVEGDSHFIGARMVADFFLADGWDVDFLGASTPGPDLVELVRRRSVDLVAISITNTDSLPRLEWTVGSLATLANPPKILLGGAVLGDTPDLAIKMGADAVAQNLTDAVLEARRLIGIAKEPVSLNDHLQNMGRKVQEIRKGLGWNQQQLADSADLDRTYISAVEHGKQNLTLGAIVKLADGLGVELGQLLSQRDRR
jgi:methanogenic corrinoid protein MtbC1/DNA-binding XRE family transcriptional regulator